MPPCWSSRACSAICAQHDGASSRILRCKAESTLFSHISGKNFFVAAAIRYSRPHPGRRHPCGKVKSERAARHLSCRDARVPAGTNRQLWCFLRLRESASAEERGLAAPNRNGEERDRKESIPSRDWRLFSQSVRLKDPGYVAVSPARGGARRLLPDILSRIGVYRCWQSWRPVGCPVNRRPTRDDDDNVEVEHVLDPVRPRAQP